jgi:hypothetical protein
MAPLADLNTDETLETFLEEGHSSALKGKRNDLRVITEPTPAAVGAKAKKTVVARPAAAAVAAAGGAVAATAATRVSASGAQAVAVNKRATVVAKEVKQPADVKGKASVPAKKVSGASVAASAAIAADAPTTADDPMAALEAAIRALNALSKSDISELKAYAHPSKRLEKVAEAVCVMLGYASPSWAQFKRLASNGSFFSSFCTIFWSVF